MEQRYNDPKAVMRNAVNKARDIYSLTKDRNPAALEVYEALESNFVKAAYQINENKSNLSDLEWIAKRTFKAMAMGFD